MIADRPDLTRQRQQPHGPPRHPERGLRRAHQRVIHRADSRRISLGDPVGLAHPRVGRGVLVDQTAQLRPQRVPFGQDGGHALLDRRVRLPARREPGDHGDEGGGQRARQGGRAPAPRDRCAAGKLLEPAVERRAVQGADLLLQEMIGRVRNLEVRGAGRQNRPLRDESDDLAPQDLAAPRAGPRLHRGEHRGGRGRVDVEQIHRDLSVAVHLEPGGLHRRQPAARRADLPGDLLGHADIPRVEIDVERHQEGPRTDRGRPGGRMDPVRPKVRIRGGILPDPVSQALELAFPDVGQALALRAGRRPRVQVDRDPELGRRAFGEPPRHRHALVHRHVPHRHERHDVGRPHPRVLARVLRQVDALGGDAHRAEGGLRSRVGAGHEREHRAVVRRIDLHVEQAHAGDARDGRPQRVEGRGVTALGEVGDAFD